MIKRIRLQKLSNTRDLGGFPGADGRRIAERKLIRSGELSKASAEDIHVLLNEYNVRTVIDLRMDAECEQTPVPELPGVKVIRMPILDGSFFGIARDEDSVAAWMRLFEDPARDPVSVFREMYRKLLFSDYVKPYYRTIFDILLHNTNGAVLWHCSAGKDRAGMVTLLVLMALGVSREVILQDYMMTDIFARKELRKVNFMIRFFIHDKRKKQCYKALLGVDEFYVRQLFDIIDRDFGGETGYLESFIGVSPTEIEELRMKYLV